MTEKAKVLFTANTQRFSVDGVDFHVQFDSEYENLTIQIDPWNDVDNEHYSITIYKNSARNAWRKAGINWAGCGTQAPDVSENFLNGLGIAVDLAKWVDNVLEPGDYSRKCGDYTALVIHTFVTRAMLTQEAFERLRDTDPDNLPELWRRCQGLLGIDFYNGPRIVAFDDDIEVLISEPGLRYEYAKTMLFQTLARLM